jgi:cell division protein FtsZ
LSLYDVNQAAAIIRETAHPDANMIFGAVVDPNMGDEIRITVIATGFERGVSRRQMVQSYARPQQAAPKVEERVSEETAVSANRPSRQVPAKERENSEPVQPKFSPNNLEIPAFLRRR